MRRRGPFGWRTAFVAAAGKMAYHGKMKTIIQLVHNDFEDLELWYPVLRMREAGFRVILAGEAAGEKYIGKYGVPATSDVSFSQADAADAAGLLVPGGWAPDRLRRFPEVLQLVRDIDAAGKPVAHICHAGWVLASAGILKGRVLTSTPGIKDDLVNAGASWKDEEVVVDRNMVSSRRPSDLPAYMRAFIGLFL